MRIGAAVGDDQAASWLDRTGLFSSQVKPLFRPSPLWFVVVVIIVVIVVVIVVIVVVV